MKDFLMTKEEYDAKGVDQIAHNAKTLVKFTADENQFNNLQPSPTSFIDGEFVNQTTQIRLPHQAL